MKKIIFIIFSFLFLSCTAKVNAPVPSFAFKEGVVEIDPNSAFSKRLEVIKTIASPANESTLRSVGQMIALANTPGDFSGLAVAWSELDAELTHSLHLNLADNSLSHVGMAIGVTNVPAEYFKQIKIGQKVEISRYGLKKSDIAGVVISVLAGQSEHDSSRVVFKLDHGQDWYPGTNCEVQFPLLKVNTVQVSTKSVLHEGFNEFIFKQVSENHYRAVPVIILNETPAEVQVVGLSENEKIISSGAILLKPLLRQFVNEQKGNTNGK